VVRTVLAVIVTQVSVFALMLLVMCLFYWLLNEQQTKDRPPYPRGHASRKIPVNEWGEHRYDLEYVDEGG